MNKRSFLEPYQFNNGATIKNRIVMAPMTTSSSFHDGQVTNDELDYYRLRAGGPGMIITAVANVSDNGKGFEGQMSISDDAYIPRLKRVANAIQLDGTKAILQIFHAGRMSNSAILRGEPIVSASPVPSEREGAEMPMKLSHEEIESILEDFEKAVLRAIKAGFDGVELHGANTYLIQQFLSPHSNRRQDQWGGSLENRMRFPLEIIKRAEKIIKTYADETFILGYRLSPEEFETPGIRMDETRQFVEVLKEQPIDYLHLSLGDVWQTPTMESEDQRSISEQIAEILGDQLPLITVGSVITPDDAERVIDAGIPFIALGKTLIREPKWVQKVERNDEESIRQTISKRDFDELAIPAAMGRMLEIGFGPIMGFTAD